LEETVSFVTNPAFNEGAYANIDRQVGRLLESSCCRDFSPNVLQIGLDIVSAKNKQL